MKNTQKKDETWGRLGANVVVFGSEGPAVTLCYLFHLESLCFVIVLQQKRVGLVAILMWALWRAVNGPATERPFGTIHEEKGNSSRFQVSI